jgi:hypothetical protein
MGMQQRLLRDIETHGAIRIDGYCSKEVYQAIDQLIQDGKITQDPADSYDGDQYTTITYVKGVNS